jgi:hypothetical protein
MTLNLAATSINASPMTIVRVAGLMVFVALIYAALCWIKPFARCDRCDGFGRAPARPLHDWLRYRNRPAQPRAARGHPTCPRCRGTGLRLRLGRRFANFLIRRHRRAH